MKVLRPKKYQNFEPRRGLFSRDTRHIWVNCEYQFLTLGVFATLVIFPWYKVKTFLFFKNNGICNLGYPCIKVHITCSTSLLHIDSPISRVLPLINLCSFLDIPWLHAISCIPAQCLRYWLNMDHQLWRYRAEIPNEPERHSCTLGRFKGTCYT